ncbi:hypothetical protein EGW08_013552, partial [Elysia chlorotica]
MFDGTTVLLLGGAVLLIILVLILEFFRVACVKREAAAVAGTTSLDSTLCESKDCVRCAKNKEVLRSALTRLSYHASDSRVSNLSTSSDLVSLTNNDIAMVTADIRASLKKLRDQVDRTRSEEWNAKEGTDVSLPIVFKCSGIREQKVWSLDDFPGMNLLEKNFTQIFLEFVHLYKSPLSETTQFWKTNQTNRGVWQVVMLVDQGRKTKASELCPITMSLIEQIPYFMGGNMFGNASFSVVHPDTEITAHYGPTNCRVRCHLGLKTPVEAESKSCSLWVEGHSLNCEEGKCIFFNDAFLHSVHHRGSPNSGVRVVLMLDLWHPDISDAQRKVLDYAFS